MLFVVGLYFYIDPFKVLYHYDSYFDAEMRSHISTSRDYVSTQMFLRNYEKYKYDSYIFGNSRSRYYMVREWQKYTHSTACFHFDANLESLYGIERKVNFLHERHVPIKNALFVIDHDLLAVTTNQNGPIYLKHPLISGQSYLDFQLSMFRSFLDVDFITLYLQFMSTHKIMRAMIDKGLTNDSAVAHYEPVPNEPSAPGMEKMIAEDREGMYKQRADVFYKRDSIQQYDLPVIKDVQLKMLEHIRQVLSDDGTDYRIVISPLYNQKKLDTTDLRVLQQMFGRDKVFDFSGKNAITNSIYNYYEASHYRPHVANEIMRVIYADSSSVQ